MAEPAHFFAMAARVIRRILVDAARRGSFKSVAAARREVSLDEALTVSSEASPDLVALDVLTAC